MFLQLGSNRKFRHYYFIIFLGWCGRIRGLPNPSAVIRNFVLCRFCTCRGSRFWYSDELKHTRRTTLLRAKKILRFFLRVVFSFLSVFRARSVNKRRTCIVRAGKEEKKQTKIKTRSFLQKKKNEQKKKKKTPQASLEAVYYSEKEKSLNSPVARLMRRHRFTKRTAQFSYYAARRVSVIFLFYFFFRGKVIFTMRKTDLFGSLWKLANYRTSNYPIVRIGEIKTIMPGSKINHGNSDGICLDLYLSWNIIECLSNATF